MKNRGLSVLDAADAEKIRTQLARVLESPPFRSSRRCSDFLRYVVEKTCRGRTEDLKERSLGVAVFEREPDYDTNQDPVVRNTAGQVRKRLAQYYCEPGRDREPRIDLPAGSYVPEIAIPEEVAEASVPVGEHLEPQTTGQRRRAVLLWLAGGITLLSIAVASLLALRGSGNDASVKAFWTPVLKHPGAVVMVVGQGHVYKLAGDLDQLFDEAEGRRLPDRTVPISEIIPSFDRFVGLTDVRALVRLAGVFSRFDKPVQLLGGRTTSLADLRGKPTVLIGAFNNSWTLNLTGELRFYFEHDAANKLEIVRDRQKQQFEGWQVRTDAAAADIRTDYAIVSRVYNPTTEQAVVVAAGIRGGGTVAAGELLTDERYMAQALREAPRDWSGKNVQFVLATKMIGGNAGPPTVIAAHYW